MSRRLFVAVVVLGIAVAGITCAPVTPPAVNVASTDNGTEAVKKPDEVLPIPKVTPKANSLETRVMAAIQHVNARDMQTTNGFWTVFHGILGLGPSVTLRHPETGEKVVAIDFVRGGGDVRGMMFLPTRHGLDVQIGPPGVGQGHQDQFVAEMGQWGMTLDTPFQVNGKEYHFIDFVRHSQMRASVKANQELSWAVIVVGQYLGTNLEWINAAGEPLRYEDMIRYELDATIDEAACGGTHRLFGLTWSYYLHRQSGGKTKGIWREVVDKGEKYKELAKKYQNADGAFSTNYFKGPGNDPDRQKRISTTGHILEWLALSLSDEEIHADWVQRAANALSLLILDMRDAPVEGGALYHAVHGLIMYYARAFDRTKLGPHNPYYPPIPKPD